MTLTRLAVSLVLAVAAFSLLTVWRAASREAAVEAAFPPIGQFVTVSGLRLHYEMSGTGPDLVLIHGASGNLRDWTFSFRDQLTDRFRVIVIDRPGLGYSDAAPEVSLAAQVRVIRDAMAALGVTDPIVVGQSYGGAVALAWALDDGPGPSPRALVLIGAASMPWPGKLGIWYRLTSTRLGRALAGSLVSAYMPDSALRNLTAKVFAPAPVPPGYADYVGAGLGLRRATLSINTAQVNGLRAELETMVPRYPDLTLPIALIHGNADTIVPLEIHARPLSKLLPNATLTVLDGAGHMPHHTHPKAVIAAIDRLALR